MGKIFGKSELKLTAAVLLFLMLLTSGYVSAASRDVELFDRGTEITFHISRKRRSRHSGHFSRISPIVPQETPLCSGSANH